MLILKQLYNYFYCILLFMLKNNYNYLYFFKKTKTNFGREQAAHLAASTGAFRVTNRGNNCK